MVIAITGYAQVGKDTAGAYFMNKGYTRVGFADKLKEMALSVLKMTSPLRYAYVKRVGWDVAKQNKWYRRFLQDFGSLMREQQEDYWIELAFDTLNSVTDAVITDLRYPNEAKRLKEEYETIIIKIERPGTGPANSHSSENQEIEADYIVTNERTIQELYWKLESILGTVIGVKIHEEIVKP